MRKTVKTGIKTVKNNPERLNEKQLQMDKKEKRWNCHGVAKVIATFTENIALGA